MKRKTRFYVITAIGLLIVTMAVAVVWIRAANRESAFRITAEWARLAPLPSTARDVTMEVKGSMFTREFILTFDAPEADVDAWLRASPGPAEAIVAGTNEIKPGGGAGWARFQVTRSKGNAHVRVDTYWS